MDFLAWLLTLSVIGYTTVLTIKTGKPLYRYHKTKNRVMKISGEIDSVYGEEITKRNGKTLKSFYPIYKCEINGQKKWLSSLVRYIGDEKEIIGQKIVILYDKETGEIWNERDIPLMKKQIKVRILVVIALLFLMIATSVLL